MYFPFEIFNLFSTTRSIVRNDAGMPYVLNIQPTHIKLNTLRPRQIDGHYEDDIFKFIFFIENCIIIQISLQFLFPPSFQWTTTQHMFKQVLELMQMHPKERLRRVILTASWFIAINVGQFVPENSLRFPWHILIFSWRDLVDLVDL